MTIRNEIPGDPFSFLVHSYQEIRIRNDNACFDKHIPNGFASLMFHFGGKVRYRAGQSEVILPDFFVAPVLYNYLDLILSPPIFTFVVVCHTSQLSKLLNISFNDCKNNIYIKLDPAIFLPLWESLNNCLNFTEKIDVFQRFLMDNFAIPNSNDQIDSIYHSIIINAPHSTVSQLQSVSPNDRKLRRNFKSRVGVNQKTLIRIVRLNYIWEQKEKYNCADYQDLIFEHGFFDQSHFIKDFKLFFGEKPTQFFKRNRRLTKIISGKNT